MHKPSTRAQIITRRTYNRPLNDEGTQFENWEDTTTRVIKHQRWLWERALTQKEWPDMPLNDITEDMHEWVHLTEEQELELKQLHSLLLERKVAVAGRTLWLGGTEIARTIAMSQFNCAAINAQTVHDIVDIFWGLLNGSGMGFRPVPGTLTGFRKVIPKVTFVPSTRTAEEKGREFNEEYMENGIWYIKIGDSAVAWAKSIGKILAGKYNAKELIIDFSEIRGGGKRLRNYGWLSQGSAGLMKSYKKVVDIMNRRADSLLSAIDILDIVNLLGTVLSTRRSAQIAIMDYSSPEWEVFATAKSNIFSDDGTETGLEHRTQSNNSILFDKKPSKDELSELMWMMHRGGKGEPGLINGVELKNRAPWATLMNPCVTSDTIIHTESGLIPVRDLIGTPFKAIINNKPYESKKGFWYTGTKPVFELTTDHGFKIKATDNHKILLSTGEWKELGDISIGEQVCLSIGDNSSLNMEEFDKGWLLGEIIGDGGFNPSKYPTYLGFWGDSQREMYSKALSIVNKLPYVHRPIELKEDKKIGQNGRLTLTSKVLDVFCWTYIEESTKEFKDTIFSASDSFLKGVISGLFDSDGSVQGNLIKGVSIRLTQTSIEKLEVVQQLLLKFGIISKIYKNRRPEGPRSLPDGNGGYKLYDCLAVHELIVSNYSFTKFGTIIGFSEPAKQSRFSDIEHGRKRKANKDSIYSKVISIDYVGEEDVYDCTVEDVHRFSANGIIVHNCAEILLPAKGGTCNLVSIDLGKFHGNNPELHEAARIISRANYRQTCIDFRDGVLQESWSLNSDHLRLCGVSLMGIAKRPDMGAYEYRTLRRHQTSAAYSMAEELNLPYPKNISTIKPEGTQSKCYDSTEGMHTPLGKYIFNNVAFSIHDPLIDVLRKANYRVFPHPYDTTAMLITLPISYEDVKFNIVDGKEVNLESAIDQLTKYKMLMDNYCDQNVSCTISYDESELEQITDWLYNNWDSYVAVSFLKRNDPTKTAKDLGYPYLPQEVVTKEEYLSYTAKLLEIDLDSNNSHEELLEDGCSGGVCPIR